jgi:hypothetical protein
VAKQVFIGRKNMGAFDPLDLPPKLSLCIVITVLAVELVHSYLVIFPIETLPQPPAPIQAHRHETGSRLTPASFISRSNVSNGCFFLEREYPGKVLMWKSLSNDGHFTLEA